MVICLVGCGGGGGGTVDSGPHDGPHADAHAADATHADAPPRDATPDAPPDAPPGTYPLTVKNYLSWCSVSVNGGTASSAGSQTVNVQPGAITLAASPLPGFTLSPNMWHHTDGDPGTGEAGTVSGAQSDATATVGNAAKCVWVCCPFTNGTGCDVPDQCP